MFSAMSLPFLLLIFGVAAIAIWIAGIQLSNTTDIHRMRPNEVEKYETRPIKRVMAKSVTSLVTDPGISPTSQS